jgi:DNA-binding NtrC family response regulator
VDFDADALVALAEAPWPGNVRELRNVVERLAILCDDATVTRADLARCALLPTHPRAADGSGPAPAIRLGPDGAPLRLDAVAREALDRAERAHITAVLALCEGNRSRAAELLGVSRRTLINRMIAYAIPRPRKG